MLHLEWKYRTIISVTMKPLQYWYGASIELKQPTRKVNLWKQNVVSSVLILRHRHIQSMGCRHFLIAKELSATTTLTVRNTSTALLFVPSILCPKLAHLWSVKSKNMSCVCGLSV